MWIFIILEDSLTLKREEHNEKECRCNSMDDCVSKTDSRRCSTKSKVASKFLQFRNHHICVEVAGKRVNPLCWIGTQNTSKLFFMEMQELWHG